MGWLDLTELGERVLDSPAEPPGFELRDGRGGIVPTKDISVRNTELLAAPADDIDADTDAPPPRAVFDDEFEAALIELGMSEPPAWDDAAAPAPPEPLEEPALPRYQIFVSLERADSVPVAERWKDDPDVIAMLHGAADAAPDGDVP